MLTAIKLWLIFNMLILATVLARAQDKPIDLTLTSDEQKVLIQMCRTAEWASRIQFTGTCEALEKKFAEAKTKPKEK